MMIQINICLTKHLSIYEIKHENKIELEKNASIKLLLIKKEEEFMCN